MINKTINNHLARHEHVLENLLKNTSIPAPRIKQAMLYSMFPGGKRLRPILVYLCGELIGVDIQSLDIIAAAIELTHCYSLIHDDLPCMDDDDLRRGKLSCHRAFDEATAILVGDGLQALAIDILLTHLPKSQALSQVIKITHELVKASGPAGMISGQSLDLSELTNPDLNEATLYKIHQLKTGRLISTCINMVLEAGKPEIWAINSLQQFADQLGIVFQMQDDYLDKYSSTDQLGKGRSSDTVNQKITFASLYNQNELFNLITQRVQEIEQTLAPFDPLGHDLLALVNHLFK